MYTAKSSFLVYWRKSSQQYGAFLIPRRNNSGLGKPDGRIYRCHGKAIPIERKRPKSPRNHTVETGFRRFRTSRKRLKERRCPRYPVCLNILRENGHSFLMHAAERNITSFVGNVKGTASRASVPFLFDARITYQRGDKGDGIRGRSCRSCPCPYASPVPIGRSADREMVSQGVICSLAVGGSGAAQDVRRRWHPCRSR